jgi:putative SOS response-associated peptidase YedK
MCNSYEQLVTYAQYRNAIRAAGLTTPASESEADLRQSDNIRIGDMGPVLRAAGNGAELVLMRFGWPAPRPKAPPNVSPRILIIRDHEPRVIRERPVSPCCFEQHRRIPDDTGVAIT